MNEVLIEKLGDLAENFDFIFFFGKEASFIHQDKVFNIHASEWLFLILFFQSGKLRRKECGGLIL
ncbi:hypothetical protein AM592_14855 [Bacillus gobiensis]|uniref:Uncharacterized protein n=1 Tax=Bacillus gobiensis TaxID=1441095 RepID=A0A0M3RA81_9BACI|nr:hypothetical protein AM592_14855 [Bacillus gobiensis]